jgi:hypothetical protein
VADNSPFVFSIEEYQMSQEGVLIVYGNGGNLGNFKYFADDLAATDLKKKFGKNIRTA